MMKFCGFWDIKKLLYERKEGAYLSILFYLVLNCKYDCSSNE